MILAEKSLKFIQLWHIISDNMTMGNVIWIWNQGKERYQPNMGYRGLIKYLWDAENKIKCCK